MQKIHILLTLFLVFCLQTVSCTNAPSFDVNYIDCNYTGTHIFVAGRHGISVILLPQACGQLRNLDDGSEHVLARYFYFLPYYMIASY